MAKVRRKQKSNNKNVKCKNKRYNYEKRHLLQAIEEVQSGKSVTQVSRKYGVPESTLRAKKMGKYADKKPGPATVLSIQEENDLTQWIFNCSRQGYPATKDDVLESVQMLCKHDGRKTPFVDKKPGRSWFEGFMKRHRNISTRISENVSIKRAKVTEGALRSWFEEIADYLNEQGMLSIDASRVFNADETGIPLNPKPPAVLAPKGTKNVYNIVNNNEKENVTVLVTANAAGGLAPSLVLFAGQSVPKDAIRMAPPNFAFGFSDNGWMTAKNFFEYVANVFQPWLEQSGIELPVILFIDGHSSHMTLPLSKFCDEHKIILIALSPNATHILQPLDVAFFRTFKLNWQKCVKSFCKNCGIISIKKSQLALVLQQTYDTIDLVDTMKNGFKTCGLHPLDADAINYNGKVFKTIEGASQDQFRPVVRDLPSNSDGAESSANEQTLKILEHVIGEERMDLFKAHGNLLWTGKIEDQSLFNVWYKLFNSVHPMGTIFSAIERDNDEGDLMDEVISDVVPESLVNQVEADHQEIIPDAFNATTQNKGQDDQTGVDDLSELVLELVVNADGNISPPLNDKCPVLKPISSTPEHQLHALNDILEDFCPVAESNKDPMSNFTVEDPLELPSERADCSILDDLVAEASSIQVKNPIHGELVTEIPFEPAKTSIFNDSVIEMSSEHVENSILNDPVVQTTLEQTKNSTVVDHVVEASSEQLKNSFLNDPPVTKGLSEQPDINFNLPTPEITESLSSREQPFLPEDNKKLWCWPKDEMTTKHRKRLIDAPKAPSVLSSPQWQLIQKKKEDEKNKKTEEAVLKKKLRLEKQELTKIEKEKNRLKKEEEKYRKEQLKIEKEKNKYLKQQEKIQKMEARTKDIETSLLKIKEAAELKEKITELQKKEAELQNNN